MIKFLNRWLRKIHRWLSVPTFLSIPLMIFARMTQEALIESSGTVTDGSGAPLCRA